MNDPDPVGAAGRRDADGGVVGNVEIIGQDPKSLFCLSTLVPFAATFPAS